MLNKVKRGALRIVRFPLKAVEKSVIVAGWTMITLGLYGAILYRAFRGDKLEEDQQEGRDK